MIHASAQLSRRAGRRHRGHDHGSRRQVDLASRADARRDRRRPNADSRVSSTARTASRRARRSRRSACRSTSTRCSRCASNGVGLRGLRARLEGARSRQLRHRHSAHHGAARGAGFRLASSPAMRRCGSGRWSASPRRCARWVRRSRRTDGKPPLRRARRRKLSGIDYELPMASAQVKSAMLLAGPLRRGTHDASTRRARAATTRERMLASMGVQVERTARRARLTPCRSRVPRRCAAARSACPATSRRRRSSSSRRCIGAPDGLLIKNVGVNPTRTGLLDDPARDGRRHRARIAAPTRRRARRRFVRAPERAARHRRAAGARAARDRRVPDLVRRGGGRARNDASSPAPKSCA